MVVVKIKDRAFDRSICPHSGKFDQTFSKKSNAQGFDRVRERSVAIGIGRLQATAMFSVGSALQCNASQSFITSETHRVVKINSY